MRRLLAQLVSAKLLLVAGCTFAAAPPLDAQIECASDAECPPSWTCHPTTTRCVPPGVDVDVEAPAIASARFVPAFARADVRVRLEIDGSEPLTEDAPVLGFAGAALPFTLDASPTPTSRVLGLVVDDEVPDGTYLLADAEVRDLAGNAATTELALSLVVDRAPPTLVIDAILPDAPHADTSGFDELTVNVVASEPLADERGLTMRIGQLSTTACTAAASLATSAYTCTLTLAPGSVPDGTQFLLITGEDRAGNVGEVFADVVVDTAPPAIEDGSVQATYAPAPGGVGTPSSLTRNGSVTIQFNVSEPLVSPPAPTIAAAPSLVFAFVQQTGLRYTYTAVLTDDIGDAHYDVVGTLTDVVGHAATLTLADVVVGQDTPAPCAAMTSDGPRCTDFDGDGRVGLTPGCETGCGCVVADCDDTDPLVYLDAPELPDDGRSNDCRDADDVHTVAGSGVFFDASAQAPGDGSPTAPFNDFATALAAAEDAALPLLAARGDVDVPAGPSLVVTVVGGLDPNAGWQRDGTTTLSTSTGGFTADGAPALDGLAFPGGLQVNAATTLVRIGGETDLDVRAQSRVVRSTLGVVIIAFAGEGTRVLQTTAAEIVTSADIEVIDCELDSLRVEGNFDVDVIDTFLRGNDTSFALFDNDGIVRLFHSTVRDGGIAAFYVSDGRVELHRSIVQSRDNDLFLLIQFNEPPQIVLEETLVDAAAATSLLLHEGNDAPNITVGAAGSDLQGLAGHPSVALLSGSIAGNAGLTSPLPALDGTGVGVDQLDPPAPGTIPTATAGDLDGACRYTEADPAADMGAREYR